MDSNSEDDPLYKHNIQLVENLLRCEEDQKPVISKKGDYSGPHYDVGIFVLGLETSASILYRDVYYELKRASV